MKCKSPARVRLKGELQTFSKVRGGNVLWVGETGNHLEKEILVAGRCTRGALKTRYRI